MRNLFFLAFLYECCFLFFHGVMNFYLKYKSRKTTSGKIFGRRSECLMVSLTFQESQSTTKGIFVRDYQTREMIHILLGYTHCSVGTSFRVRMFLSTTRKTVRVSICTSIKDMCMTFQRKNRFIFKSNTFLLPSRLCSVFHWVTMAVQ